MAGQADHVFGNKVVIDDDAVRDKENEKKKATKEKGKKSHGNGQDDDSYARALERGRMIAREIVEKDSETRNRLKVRKRSTSSD